MRYLTHESEDSFWLRQGCKPHPLVKKEAARLRHQYANFEVIQEHKISKNTTNGSIPNVATVTNQAIKTTQPTATIETSTANATGSSGSEASPENSRKSYISLHPGDIENLETHARRVGYTISTV